MDADRIIRAYMKIRDKRAEIKEKFTEEDDKLKAQLEELETHMMGLMDGQGATDLKTAAGIAFFQEDMKANIADWGAFGEWCVENDGLDMLQRRVAIRQLREYLKEYDELPPGVSVFRERKVRIRKN